MFRALERHCGSRGVRPGVAGRPVLVQQGRNLAGCATLIAGEGIIRASAGTRLARQALDRLPDPVLAPRRCRILVDRRYVLAAAGLLARPHPEIAESLLTRELLEESAHEGQ
jgi:MutL protein